MKKTVKRSLMGRLDSVKSQFVVVVVILVSLVVLVGVTNKWLTVADGWVKSWMRQQAVQECLKVGYVEEENIAERKTIVTPDKDVYGFCMAEKGYL